MALFDDLVIEGKPDSMTEFRRRLGDAEVPGWRRDMAAEDRFRSMKAGPAGVLCVVREADGILPAVAFWFVPEGRERLRLANVIPLDRGSILTEVQFRELLNEFKSRFYEPLMGDLAVEWDVVSRSDPASVLSTSGLRKFRSFVDLANRQGLHPTDVMRWNEFLVQIHRDGSAVDPEMLREWLPAEEWPDKVRHNLVHEFESARSLLSVYDEEIAAR